MFFQAREAANPFYDAVPGIVAEVFDELAARTGRRYGLVDYVGAADAERVIVLMGSAAGAADRGRRGADRRRREGRRSLTVRLYRPFPAAALRSPPCRRRRRSIAVLDRTKEPGAVGEPLYLDVLAALAEATDCGRPAVRPRHAPRDRRPLRPVVQGVHARPCRRRVRRAGRSTRARSAHFTVGIYDDVTRLSPRRRPTPSATPAPAGEVQAMFFGLGSDGTVGANKSSVKIIGEQTDLFAQGYFVYDSKKSGSVTVSHLRFGPEPIRSTYLIDDADFVACHQFGLLEKMKVLDVRQARARRSCSTARAAPTRCGTTCRSRCSAS